jgi:hypothetical protein
MDNGDRFFTRLDAIVQTKSGNLSATQVGNITGGTGQFAAMQGIVRRQCDFNYNTGFTECQIDIEYSVGK